jgi:AraC-like DNA-binding protein
MKLEKGGTSFSYQTVDRFDASKQLLRHFGDHQLLPEDSRTFLFREHASHLGGLVVHDIEFVGGVIINGCDPHGHILVHLMLSGEVVIGKGKGKKTVLAGEAFVLGPARAPSLYFPNGGHLLIVQIEAPALEQHARKLIRHAPQEPLSFEMSGFHPGSVGNFKEVINLFLMQHRHGGEGDGHRQVREQQVEQFLLTEILLTYANNYSSLLNADRGNKASRTVRLAREYMDANIASPINLDDLCEATGVSKRSLLYAFRQHCQTTPMNYLAALRLDGLRDELQAAGPGARVTDLGLKWGFSNPGRLAKYYQKRFGELPSTTLTS